MYVKSVLLLNVPVEAARKAASLVRRVVPSDLSVLILGPSGSGKEVIAQMIHRYSDRRDKPFVAVNYGSIPNDLQSSEFLVRSKMLLPELLQIGKEILNSQWRYLISK